MKRINATIALALALLTGCEDYYNTANDPVIYGDTYFNAAITTDKACYKPGETVTFALKDKPPGSLRVRYSHLGTVIGQENLTSDTWRWTAPEDDYKGYLADICETVNGEEKIYYSIAVDVSSDWKKFPRYGFLSAYGKLSQSNIENNINNLNRFHINGIQFYDWMYDHHRPLAGTVENPADSWLDLIGRTNYHATVKGYIDAAHDKGMKAMFYNLAFGALSNAASDGVREEWYVFKDANRTEKDNHHLDAPFRSSIYLTDPGNTQWQDYLAGRHDDVYAVFDFDGYHIDQLGNRGTLYDYNGNPVSLEGTFASFIASMKQAQPEKRLIMNAVSQYGQESIARAEVDVLYTEVWDESSTFEHLARVITDNNAYSGGQKQTILAAYMNYRKSGNSGFVNMPGILLSNAVIFSFGGAHLEVGEHYLANEYFPNSNLQLTTEMKQMLLDYYDFLVAYQNLLRDGGTFGAVDLQSTDDKISPQSWPASQGKVAVTGKLFADRQVVHLINFGNANSMEWRDTNGTQGEPELITDAGVKVSVSKTVSKVWLASPDVDGGVAQPLQFAQSGNEIRFTIPSLKYWNMIVIE